MTLRLLVALIALLLLLPGTAQAWEVDRDVDIHSLDHVDDKGLKATVFLPDGFDERETYPVLYLLHGFGEYHSTWPHEARGRALALAAAARFKGIIVMPDQRDGFSTDFHNFGEFGKPAWTRHFFEKLIPLIEGTYPIRKGRQWHAIAGASMGGFGALTLAGQLPGYFGSVAIFSAPTDVQRPESPLFMPAGGNYVSAFGPPDGAYATGHNPIRLVENLRHTRLFARVGDGIPEGADVAVDGFLVDRLFLGAAGPVIELWVRMRNEEYVAAARTAGVDVDYAVRPGSHDWPYLSRMFAEALEWGFFGDVKSDPREWSYSTIRQKGQAWDLAYEFKEPPATVVRFTRSGSKISATGSGTVTISSPRCSFTSKLPFERTC